MISKRTMELRIQWDNKTIGHRKWCRRINFATSRIYSNNWRLISRVPFIAIICSILIQCSAAQPIQDIDEYTQNGTALFTTSIPTSAVTSPSGSTATNVITTKSEPSTVTKGSLSVTVDTNSTLSPSEDDSVSTNTTSTTLTFKKSTTSKAGIRPQFTIGRHPRYPMSILQVFYSPEPAQTNYYLSYRVNYTDLSSAGLSPPGSYSLTGTNPFDIHQLNAGHEYRIDVIGRPMDTTKPQQLLHSETAMTEPRAPVFSGATAVTSTTRTIMLKGSKPSGALQDSFRVDYSQVSPAKTFDPLTIPDVPEQKNVELYIPNLSPGRQYNVSVISTRKDVNSRPWNTLITTKPLPPVDVVVENVQSEQIKLRWQQPTDSGVDSYRVFYQIVNDPNNQTDSSQVSAVRDLVQPEVSIETGLTAGHTYEINVNAVASGETSEANTLYVTTRPLSPLSMRVAPSAEEDQFVITVQVPASVYSLADGCLLTIQSDNQRVSTRNLTTNDIDRQNPTRAKCSFMSPLTPGERYELSARLTSNGYLVFHVFFQILYSWTETIKNAGSVSSPFVNNTVVRPAFDRERFGIQATLLEEPLDDIIRVSYIDQYNGAALLRPMWSALVGTDSKLLIKVLDHAQRNNEFERNLSPLNDDQIGGVDFTGLILGQCYKVLMYTVTRSGIVSANQSTSYIRTRPAATDITLYSKTSSSVQLDVQSTADSPVCRLNITIKTVQGEFIEQRTQAVNKEISVIRVENLKPYTQYHCWAVIECGNEEDPCGNQTRRRTILPKEFQTDESVPGPVQSPQVHALKPYHAQLSWQPPAQRNGRIIDYLVTVQPSDNLLGEQPWNITVPADLGEKIDVRNLTGGQQYSFGIMARTRAGLGPAFQAQDSRLQSSKPNALTHTMPIWAPPEPTGYPEILSKSVQPTSFNVRFHMDMLSTRNGLLSKYAIVVVEVDEEGNAVRTSELTHEQKTSGVVMDVAMMLDSRTWSMVHAHENWPPYIALEKPLPQERQLPAIAVTEVIGADTDCPNVNEYCNGALRPARRYKVKLRVWSSPDLFTDSDYSTIIDTESDPQSHASIWVAVVLSVLVIACVLLLVVLFTRTTNAKHFKQSVMSGALGSCMNKLGLNEHASHSSNSTPRLAHLISAPHSSAGHGPSSVDCALPLPQIHQTAGRSKSLKDRSRIEPISTQHPHSSLQPLHTIVPGTNIHMSRPVKKENFSEHVRLMSADSDFRFSEEYEEFKQVGRGLPAVAADLACNRPKNRFTNILPFDHSRVKLVPMDDEDGSDYVNANYIPGHNSPREFIAAQGPLPCTRDDFWRMIWEQQCPAVVCLTKCVEKGREKCDKYWPEGTEPVKYWDLEVCMKNERVFEDWVVHEFQVTHLEDDNERARIVQHFHFIGWPDFGVPDRPQSLVQFVRAFRKQLRVTEPCKPTIVHCSAGVGRSGTFIALDRTLQQLINGADVIDIFAIVHQMRKERVLMVQNEQQYICIHQCVQVVLEGRENATQYSHTPAQYQARTGHPQQQYPMAVPTPVVSLPRVSNSSGFGSGGSSLTSLPSTPSTQSRSNHYLPSSASDNRMSTATNSTFLNSTPRLSQNSSPDRTAEVHQNPAFLDDDEGIVESGL